MIEHDDLRRARDGEHYRLARQLRRTLITLDRDYLDDKRFPPEESGGVIVLTAPEKRGYLNLLTRLDREVFRAERSDRSAGGPQAARPRRLERPAPSGVGGRARLHAMIVLSRRPVCPAGPGSGRRIRHRGRRPHCRRRSGARCSRGRHHHRRLHGCFVVPGFIDVHVHGVEGLDTLDGGRRRCEIARKLPRYGVTAFCPTTVACGPDDAGDACSVRSAEARPFRRAAAATSARVLPAHLESNFINPEFRGAQPLKCLRLARRRQRGADRAAVLSGRRSSRSIANSRAQRRHRDARAGAPQAGSSSSVPLAPRGHQRVAGTFRRRLRGRRCAAIDAGARHATHLFNRMTPLTHRAPGLAGAVLARDEVAAELICDGYHVHPAMCGVAHRAQRARRA